MLVIIHGWSDTSDSFRTLGRRLVRDRVVEGVTHVRLGDYISLDDDVTFDDVARALDVAWATEGLSKAPRSVDVVAHSTGALVVRHWMTQYYEPATNPVHRFLMLGPANFGSPLAHKGRSFLGRIVKGFKADKPFQTGTHILRGLELASPFTWDLALDDRFDAVHRWYGPDAVLATVLVGTSGYSGISAAANEPGTDGTVRVATANLNPLKVTLDFRHELPAPGRRAPPGPPPSITRAHGITAFARIPEENHSTIALKDRGPRNDGTLTLIKRALRVTDADFLAFAEELEASNRAVRKAVKLADRERHGFQDTVIRLKDDLGHPVPDFFFEIFAKAGSRVNDELTCEIQEKVVQKVHAYDGDASRRSLHLDRTALDELFRRHGKQSLYLSLTAMPDYHKTGSVGYTTVEYHDIGSIKLDADHLDAFIQPDRTVLTEILISRRQHPSVFRFSKLAG